MSLAFGLLLVAVLLSQSNHPLIQPTMIRPTWRTRFVMWGTESYEEWHVFAFSRGDEATGEPACVIAEVCIDTPSINHMDVFAIVLSKAANVSNKLSDTIDQIVMDRIGYPLKPVNNDIYDPDPDYEMKR